MDAFEAPPPGVLNIARQVLEDGQRSHLLFVQILCNTWPSAHVSIDKGLGVAWLGVIRNDLQCSRMISDDFQNLSFLMNPLPGSGIIQIAYKT